METQRVPAGWYQNLHGQTQWWDGEQWGMLESQTTPHVAESKAIPKSDTAWVIGIGLGIIVVLLLLFLWMASPTQNTPQPIAPQDYQYSEEELPPVFANCSEARAYGAAPVHEGDPGWGPHLDADNDGVGCEPWHEYDYYDYYNDPNSYFIDDHPY